MKHPRVRLKAWRDAQNLPQHEACKMLGIGQQYLSMIERQLYPSVKVAQRIEEVTGIPALLWTQFRLGLKRED